MHMNTKTLSIGLIVAAVLLFAAAILSQYDFALGSAPSGLPNTVRYATTTSVGPQGTGGRATTIFAANPTCTARTISTVSGSGVGIYFLTADPVNGDLSSTTQTFVNGNFQAGSTTVTYDAGLNGCGRWTARAISTTTITVTEYQ